MAPPDYFQIAFVDVGGAFYATNDNFFNATFNASVALCVIVYLTPAARVQVQTQNSIVAGATVNGAAIRTYFMAQRLS